TGHVGVGGLEARRHRPGENDVNRKRRAGRDTADRDRLRRESDTVDDLAGGPQLGDGGVERHTLVGEDRVQELGADIPAVASPWRDGTDDPQLGSPHDVWLPGTG